MAPTNLTDLQNARGFYDIMVFVNNNTGGIIGTLTVLSIFVIILFIAMRKSTFEESLMAASFMGFTLSIGLTVLQLLSWQFILGFTIIMAFDGYYLYKTKNWQFL